MTRILLDTTVLIDLSRNAEHPLARIKAKTLMEADIAVCAVSVAEFFTGVPIPERQHWERWIANFEYWETPRETAILAGVIRFDMARKGRAIHIPDAMIAATALANRATLVTDNIKDYQIEGLSVLQFSA